MTGPRASFPYADGRLTSEAVDLETVAAAVGTPVYCYAQTAIEQAYDRFVAAFAPLRALVCYAAKANSNQAVLKALALRGAGMDVVSGGELARALAVGVPGERITFSGVGKTDAEIDFALRSRIRCFNVESEPELDRIALIAGRLGAVAPIALRVNPDVDALTHAKIATGAATDKFGVPIDRAGAIYGRAAAHSALAPCGVDVHIGSQITTVEPFAAAFARVADLVRGLRHEGLPVRHVDLGGGLGVPYRETDSVEPLERYAALIADQFGALDVEVILEPGRFLVANAGVLLTRVLYVKRSEAKSFIIVDAGMNDLIRPTLYDAFHEIAPLRERTGAASSRFDVVGPVCETGDFLARDRSLPIVEAGDCLAVFSAGAYGAVQSGTYNSRPLPPEVMLRQGQWSVIRPRLAIEALIQMDRIPPWLERAAG
jgi:diaminopimelate decarboxylase